MNNLTKFELRKRYLHKRKALSSNDILHLSEKICKNITRYFLNDGRDKNIHLFLPIKNQNEVDLWFLIRMIFAENKDNIFIPKVVKSELQTHILTQDTILKENKWGILESISEPCLESIKFDLVITPLVYCDNEGNRVGYGKGFYDRFFAKINKDAIRIGVNFFPPKERILDVSGTDIALNFLITPEEIFSFNEVK